MTIANDILYVGVDDHELDLFEGQYDVPGGMAYNSYVILDEKCAVLDAVDAKFGEAWLAKVREALGERTPDYLIVHHMEPDHSANICLFAKAYPEAKIVASAKAFDLMKSFYGSDFADRRCVVKEGDVLELGRHSLQFIAAPMVHWPEVLMSYDAAEKVLFSADAFGKFGAQDYDDPEGWDCEARRYYFGIVGKYGMQVQNVLKKAAKLDIQKICALHGPVLTENIGYYLDKYNTWSSYQPENEGVTIAYTSVYGHTKEAVEKLAELLQAKGVKVSCHDLARMDMPEAVEDAFRYDRLVLATTTYNADIFPFMKTFIDHLAERGYQNRTLALIENGSWAPMAAKVMKKLTEGWKNIRFAETTVTVKSALDEGSLAQIAALAEELA